MVTKNTRIGIIGIGGICKVAHLPTYKNNPCIEIAGLCDIIEDRALSTKKDHFPNASVYTDYKEMLKDESIEAVDICTPDYLHSIITVDALNAGKHVLCEKPDAINPEEALKMQEAADKIGKVLMVMRYKRGKTVLFGIKLC